MTEEEEFEFQLALEQEQGGLVKAKPTRSIPQELGRQLGLTARAAGQALSSPITIGSRALNKTISALGGPQHAIPFEASDVGASLTRLGLPEAETGVERVTQGIAETLPVALAAPASVPAQAAMGAVISSTQAAPGEEAKAALTGAALGGGGQMVGNVLGRTLAGVRPTPQAQELINRGVPLTAGQMAGPGIINGAEQVSARMPGPFGSPMRDRLAESLRGWQGATRAEAAAPGQLDTSSISALKEGFTDSYLRTLRNAKFRPGTAPIADPARVVAAASRGKAVTLAERQQLYEEIQEALTGNNATPTSLHAVEARLKDYLSSIGTNPERAAFRRMASEAIESVRNQWRNSLTPYKQQELAAIDAQYAKFVPTRNAAMRGQDTLLNPENYTPMQLAESLRRHARGSGETRWLQGDRPMQGLTGLGEEVIGSNPVPRPSTMYGATGGGLGIAAGMAGYAPLAMGVGALSRGIGTPTGQSLLKGQAPGQQAIAEALRRLLSPAAVSQQGE